MFLLIVAYLLDFKIVGSNIVAGKRQIVLYELYKLYEQSYPSCSLTAHTFSETPWINQRWEKCEDIVNVFQYPFLSKVKRENYQ